MDKNMAALFERLLTKSCLSEAQLAVKYEGQNVFASSFEILGKVAGQEMYSDPLVSKSMSNFTQYMDKKNVEKAFGATKK